MNHLVVARYEEDTGWLDGTPDGWDVLVVQKGDQVPNEGREASSFFWALQQLYSTQGQVAFVQGNPFEHCPDLWRRLTPDTGFKWLGRNAYVSDGNGEPWDAGLPVAEKYEAWVGAPWPGQITFAAGGQFIVPGHLIRRRPYAQYRWLQAEMGHGKHPWVMERLWRDFFTVKGKQHGGKRTRR